MINEHFESFQHVYDERFQAKVGYWRGVVEQSVATFLKCGDLQEGIARVRCPDCKRRPCKAWCPVCRLLLQTADHRCTTVPACPSYHQTRALLTAIHAAEEVCLPVAHRQVVLSIPQRLRLHTRDPGLPSARRKLLGKLCAYAWTCLQAEAVRLPATSPMHQTAIACFLIAAPGPLGCR